MPLSEEQKQVLRDRMKLAREAKVAKKKLVQEIVAEPKPEPKPEPKVEPKVEPKPVVEIPFEEPLPKPKALSKAPVPEAKLEKPAKTKYAKLVFYQEPTAKKMKKLSKVLESSSDEDDVVVVKPKVSFPVAKPQPVVDERKAELDKMKRISAAFFD